MAIACAAARVAFLVAIAGGIARRVDAQQSNGPLNEYGNPLKHVAQPTTPAISPDELRTRLYIFADDSMQGRQVGRIGNMKGTAYIAAELKRLGLEPAGDSGTYFQRLPYVQRKFSDRSTLSVNGRALGVNTDFVPIPGARAPRAVENVPVIYGGVDGDPTRQITAAQAAGKFVVMSPSVSPAAPAGGRGGAPAGSSATTIAARFPEAVAVALIDLDALSPAQRGALNNPAATNAGGRGGGRGAGDVVVTNDRGGIGLLRDGGLVGGVLPTGQTVATVQARLDSVRHADAVLQAGAALRRDSMIYAARTFAAAGGRGGSFSFYGETISLDAGQVAALAAAAPSGRGGGGAGGAGAGAGAGAGRGGGAGAAAQGGPSFAPALPPLTATFRITTAAATRLLGKSPATLQAGATGGSVTAKLDYQEVLTDWGRNVVGIVRGSDPTLRGEYVAIGAHNDHIGMTTPVDHDSLKAFNDALIKFEMQLVPGDLRAPTTEQRAAIRVNMDSVRRLHPVPRMDSVSNGADDDGSGSMAVLEIAEAINAMPVKPKRSMLFVWHTGEESGLTGSAYYVNNPTVPLDSIVAQVNIDMIGRGRVDDMVGGGPTYVGAVGSKRLSTELNQEMLAVNSRETQPLRIDYRFDDPTLGTSVDGKPISWPGYNNIYGRSDHANYANKCIPIVFFFTGLHGDYHQRTDEPQYIDYPHYTMIASYIRDLMVDVGNRASRPQLDTPCVRR